MFELFTLLILFQLKHFICDYPLQTYYMLGKANRFKWALPLATHSSVHALGTFLIVLLFNPAIAVYLALMDFILHFIVDRLKASPNYGGRFKIEQPQFWWALGVDQMTHHLINYVFIYLIIFW